MALARTTGGSSFCKPPVRRPGSPINTTLFQDGSGNNGNNGIGYNDPAGNYVINYKAILALDH